MDGQVCGPRHDGAAREGFTDRADDRTLDALGYVALVLLAALIIHRLVSQVSRAPERQIAMSTSVQGASVEPAAQAISPVRGE